MRLDEQLDDGYGADPGLTYDRAAKDHSPSPFPRPLRTLWLLACAKGRGPWVLTWREARGDLARGATGRQPVADAKRLPKRHRGPLMAFRPILGRIVERLLLWLLEAFLEALTV